MAILATVCLSAGAWSVQLRAVDTDDEPESYATCRIFAAADTVKAAVTGLTDSVGAFTAKLPAAGAYILRLESAGQLGQARRTFTLDAANPDANLGTIVTGGLDENLREITVTAQRPLVVKQIDRIGYDIQADPDSKVLTLQEMLRRVPMVSVDADGTIKVNGSSNFVIYKNGRPNNSLSKNAKDILAAIPASMIKSVEVITEPGARYDAEGIGAILNIVTVDDAVIDGVTGTVSARVTSTDWLPGPNGYITAQVGKVTLSFNGGANFMSRKTTKSQNKNVQYLPGGLTHTQNQNGHSKGAVAWFGGEGSWEINKKNLLTFEFNGFAYNVKPNGSGTSVMTGADGSVISSYAATYDYDKYQYFDMDGTVNYELQTSRKGETLTASYMISTTDQQNKGGQAYSDIVGNAFAYTGTKTDTKLKFYEHTFQLDWKRPFAEKHTLETGAKYVLRDNHSNNINEYTGVNTEHTQFKHLTDIGAVYAQYTGRFGKWTLRGGLRYEYSRLKAEYPDGSHDNFASNLSDWVPSASASWSINDANSLTLNFATRINRPGISYLDPTHTYTPTTLSYGAPGLESAYSRSMKLTYMLIKQKFNINFSASYSWNNDNISSIQFYDDATGLMVSTYGNVGHERTLNFSGFAQWTITPKTRFMINSSVSRNSFRQEGYSLARWSFFGFGRISQDLPWKLTAEIGCFYMSKSCWDVYSVSGGMRPNYNISLRKSLLKEDRLTVAVMVQNPIGSSTRHWRTETVNGNYLGWSDSKQFNQKAVGIVVSYRFGSLKAQVKKTAASITNDDMVGGAGNGGGSGSSSGQGSSMQQ